MAAELAAISLLKFESPDMKRPVAPDARSIYALPMITHLLLYLAERGGSE